MKDCWEGLSKFFEWLLNDTRGWIREKTTKEEGQEKDEVYFWIRLKPGAESQGVDKS